MKSVTALALLIAIIPAPAEAGVFSFIKKVINQDKENTAAMWAREKYYDDLTQKIRAERLADIKAGILRREDKIDVELYRQCVGAYVEGLISDAGVC